MVAPVVVAAAISAASSVLKPTPAAPSSADSVFSTNLAFDNSGWNVAFGNAKVSSTSDKDTSQGGSGGLSGNMSTYLPWALIFVGGLIALKIIKK